MDQFRSIDGIENQELMTKGYLEGLNQVEGKIGIQDACGFLGAQFEVNLR